MERNGLARGEGGGDNDRDACFSCEAGVRFRRELRGWKFEAQELSSGQ